MNNLSTTVKMLRKQYNLTQEELSLKSGVGLRFVRDLEQGKDCLLYTSPSPRDRSLSRMPSSA